MKFAKPEVGAADGAAWQELGNLPSGQQQEVIGQSLRKLLRELANTINHSLLKLYLCLRIWFRIQIIWVFIVKKSLVRARYLSYKLVVIF